MEIFIWFVFMFLAIIGLSEIVHYIQLAILDTKKKKSRILCCFLEGNTAELDLKFVAEQYNWLGRKYADRVLAVDCLNNNDLSLMCRSIAERNNIDYIYKRELSKYIIGESDERREQNRA